MIKTCFVAVIALGLVNAIFDKKNYFIKAQFQISPIVEPNDNALSCIPILNKLVRISLPMLNSSDCKIDDNIKIQFRKSLKEFVYKHVNIDNLFKGTEYMKFLPCEHFSIRYSFQKLYEAVKSIIDAEFRFDTDNAITYARDRGLDMKKDLQNMLNNECGYWRVLLNNRYLFAVEAEVVKLDFYRKGKAFGKNEEMDLKKVYGVKTVYLQYNQYAKGKDGYIHDNRDQHTTLYFKFKEDSECLSEIPKQVELETQGSYDKNFFQFISEMYSTTGVKQITKNLVHEVELEAIPSESSLNSNRSEKQIDEFVKGLKEAKNKQSKIKQIIVEFNENGIGKAKIELNENDTRILL